MEGGDPQNVINSTFSEVKLQERTHALLLLQTNQSRYYRYLTQQQPLLNHIFKEVPIIPHRKGRSLRHSRKSKIITKERNPESCRPVNPHQHTI